MMECIIKTMPGLEDIAINEISSILKTKPAITAPNRIHFKSNNIKKLIKNAKSPELLYKLLKRIEFKSVDDIIKEVGSIDFSFIKTDFVVRCSRTGAHNFVSADMERLVGELIFHQGFKVNLKSETIIYVDIIESTCFIGILVYSNFGKRKYRVKINNQSITPTLAYFLLKIAGLKASDSVLDPFCKDGVILIEASLIGCKRLYGMDDSNNIRNARINASLAEARIDFHVKGMDNLKPKKVKKIITNLPFPTKKSNQGHVKSILNSFFNYAKKIAEDIIVIITRNDKYIKEITESHGLKILRSRRIQIGQQNYSIMALKPK